MQIRKGIFLGLALLLPIAIFIFLKLFGKNEFDVAAFYQDEVPPPSADCNVVYSAPYRLPDSVMTLIRTAGESRLYLVSFTSARLPERISEKMTAGELSFVDFKTRDERAAHRLKKCAFILRSENKDLVMIDHDGKIRGYYSSSDREDVDRLLLELDILLKKY